MYNSNCFFMVSLESDFNIKLINDYLSPSNIYGFILFTDEHPYMKKVMRDEDFWLEFNEKSGVYWLIFSVKALQKQDISYNRKVLDFFELNNAELRSTPFVAWEASKSLDKLEMKDCIRHGFYGLGKVSNFVYSVIKILHI